MKSILKVEELAMLLLSLYAFSFLSFNWWWYAVFFFVPDISFFGYVISTRVGAFCYNVVHHKGIAILCYLVGIYVDHQVLQFIGIVVFGHASFDRILGYGLKYADSFNHTHLGKIGKKDV